MSAIIRKIVTVVEETRLEMGQAVTPPTRRAAAIAVIENPFAGRYVDDLSPLIEIGEEIGPLLSKRAVAALGIDGARAQSYGKAAAVGENGELEHAAAILHPKMGAPVRKVLTKGAALIPSSKKRSGPGTTLDIPLGHKDAAFVRSHFDGMEVMINDAPRANEIMVAVAVTDSGRPLPRVGGLAAVILGDDDQLLAVDAARGIDFLDRQLPALAIGLGERRQQRVTVDFADLDLAALCHGGMRHACDHDRQSRA